jgi:hypothetical protein
MIHGRDAAELGKVTGVWYHDRRPERGWLEVKRFFMDTGRVPAGRE